MTVAHARTRGRDCASAHPSDVESCGLNPRGTPAPVDTVDRGFERPTAHESTNERPPEAIAPPPGGDSLPPSPSLFQAARTLREAIARGLASAAPRPQGEPEAKGDGGDRGRGPRAAGAPFPTQGPREAGSGSAWVVLSDEQARAVEAQLVELDTSRARARLVETAAAPGETPGGWSNTPLNGQARGAAARKSSGKAGLPERPETGDRGGGGSKGKLSAAPRLLGARVDWLTIAFRLDAPDHVVSLLAARCEAAARLRTAVGVTFPNGVTVGVKGSRRRGWCAWECDDASGTFDAEAPGGWWLSVDITGEQLAGLTVEAALALAWRIAEAFADGAASVLDARLRRCDLAADFAGWELREVDGVLFLTKRRTGRTGYVETPEERTATRTHGKGVDVTGFTVAPGSPLMLRVYDKRAQLAHLNDEDRTEREESTWRAHGWDGAEPVTRVEFQLRGEALAEFPIGSRTLRDLPRALPSQLDALWAYLTREWVRIIVADTATRRKNCDTDPRWEAARAVTFKHAADALKRRRRVGRAALSQAFGCAVSALADGGRVTRVPLALADDGVVLDAGETVRKWSAPHAETFVRKRARELMTTAGDSFADALMQRFDGDAHAAAEWLVEKLNGAVALRTPAAATEAGEAIAVA